MDLIEIKSLCKEFDNKQILKKINLKIPKGKIIGLLGKNGAGKTTLIKLINDLLTLTSGEILIEGEYPGVNSKDIISYLPERTYLDKEMTIKQAIRYFEDFYINFDSQRAKKLLKDLNLDNDYDCCIFTGGEERFELLTGFNLVENTLFNDGVHKYMLSLEDYISGTEKVFYEITLDELYKLMPNNPKWMDGARSGAIIPLTLFKKANVKWIIPSDLNLINGVINDL